MNYLESKKLCSINWYVCVCVPARNVPQGHNKMKQDTK